MGTPEMSTNITLRKDKVNGDTEVSLNISAIDNNTKKNSIGKSSFFNIRPKSARSTGKEDITTITTPKSTPIKDDKKERELRKLKEKEEKKRKKKKNVKKNKKLIKEKVARSTTTKQPFSVLKFFLSPKGENKYPTNSDHESIDASSEGRGVKFEEPSTDRVKEREKDPFGEVEQFLNNLELAHYVPIFKREAIGNCI